MNNLITSFSNLINIVDLLTNKVANVSSQSTLQDNVIFDRLAILEDKIEQLKFLDAAEVSDIAELNKPDTNIIVNISEPLSGTTEIIGNDINVKALTVSDGLTKITATGEVIIKNLKTSGNLPKATANAQFSVNTDDYVKITQSDINQTGYNAIEVGLKSLPKSVIIDGVNFNSELSNNAISIFGTQDNGTITISNCTFAKCSNPIRLSNKNGGKVTVNIINCTFSEWDTDPLWAGMIICQDYTSGSTELEEKNNLFAPDKVTINIVNCTKNGKKITMKSPEEVCGTGNAETQLIYVWNSYGETVSYDETRYPIINVE